MAQEHMIYKFTEGQSLEDWRLVNDDVMGGVSQSAFDLNSSGHAVFTGDISLDNNGGFASLRLQTEENDVQEYAFVNLTVRGKPTTFQFRIKNSMEEAHSYVQEFTLTSEWNTVQLKLSDFYPRYRGRSLNLPNFEAQSIQEIAFLIGNKTEEHFELEIDKIYLSN